MGHICLQLGWERRVSQMAAFPHAQFAVIAFPLPTHCRCPSPLNQAARISMQVCLRRATKPTHNQKLHEIFEKMRSLVMFQMVPLAIF